MSGVRFSDKKIKLWINISVWAAAVAFVGLFIIYIWGFPIHFDTDHYEPHTGAIGTFGDFIGGVFGTIFTFLGSYLMYVTLRAQRLLTRQSDLLQRDLTNTNIEAQQNLAKASAKEASLERFNSLFFELLNLLNTQRVQLNQSVEEAGYEGMNYFDVKRIELEDSFVPSWDYGKNVNKAANHYRKFYLKNAPDLAPYFRTLYRIMDLIEESEIEEDERRQFAKIIRAHLRESELFFLRYNAMIEYGQNFIEYINKYKLLKHLPIMSLMEMKKFKEIVNRSGRSELPLNLIIHDCRKKIFHFSKNRATIDLSSPILLEDYDKYRLIVDLSNPTKTELKLTINPFSSNKLTRFVPFYAFTNRDFEAFLKCVLQEIYKYSNFKQYNSEGNLKFKAHTNIGPLIEITAYVRNTHPLQLLHPAWRG